jgi:hypothetical protein
MTKQTPKHHYWQLRSQGSMALLTVLALSGCTTYRPSPAESVPTPSDVRIQFEPPRSIVVHRSSFSDSLTVPDVIELRGRLIERTGDMLTVEVSRAEMLGSRTPQRFGSGSVARVPIQDLEVKETHTGRTVLLVVGSITLLALLIAALASESEPEPPPPTKDEGSKS